MEEEEEEIPEPGEGEALDKQAVCHIVEVVETDVQLNQQLVAESQVAQECQDQQLPADVNLALGEDPEGAVVEHEGMEIEPEIGGARSLQDVLIASDLQKFLPTDKDDENELFKRIQKLSPHLEGFSAFVRIGEGLLSRASVTGQVRTRNQQQILEHELAEARTEFVCSQGRQSRLALWQDFSNRVEEALKPVEGPKPDSAEIVSAGAKKIQAVSPSSFRSANGDRICQLLLVKPFLAGGSEGPLRLGVVVGAWRGGKSKKQHVWPEGHLPVSSATKVHVRLLTPQGEKNQNGDQLCVASSVSAVLSLGAHDGSILLEVPTACYTVEYTDTHLMIWISKKTVQALSKINQACVPFHAKKKNQEAVAVKAFFSEDDFGRTATGMKNVQLYLQQMKRDYEKIFPALENEKGNLILRNDIQVTFSEILARASSYFKKYLKGSEHWKGLTKEYQQLPYLCQHYGSVIFLEFYST